MDVGKITKEIIEAEIGSRRTSLYLNKDRLARYYFRSGGVGEVDVTTGWIVGGEAGAPSWWARLGIKVDRNRSKTERISIYQEPTLMALIFEEHTKRSSNLLELSLGSPTSVERLREATFLKYMGPSYTMWPDEYVEAQVLSHTLPFDLAQVVERDCVRQQDLLRKLGIEEYQCVAIWTPCFMGTDNGVRQCFASVAAMTYIDIEEFVTSFSDGPGATDIGIFGTFEKQIDDVVFITPIWVWRDW